MDGEAKRDVGLRLKQVRNELSLSQAALAAKLGGCTSQFISQVEHGKSAPSASIVAGVERLGFSGSWLMTGRGQPRLPAADEREASKFVARDAPRESQFRALPILGCVPAGYPGVSPAEEVLEGYFSLPISEVTDPAAFCLRVAGDSMAGLVEHDDLVVVSPARADRLRQNDLVVVRIEPGDTWVKRWMSTDQGVCLLSANPKYPPIVIVGRARRGIEIVGKVTQIVHRLP